MEEQLKNGIPAKGPQTPRFLKFRQWIRYGQPIEGAIRGAGYHVMSCGDRVGVFWEALRYFSVDLLVACAKRGIKRGCPF